MSEIPSHHHTPAPDHPDLDALLASTYDELRAIAHHQMQAERSDHTMQPTAIVHEAYVRLVKQRDVEWINGVHFKSVASQMIRRILVDYARARNAIKRGGDGGGAGTGAGKSRRAVTIHDLDAISMTPEIDLLALDDALQRLHEIDEVQSRVVELRFFGGLTIGEIAETLGIGKRSVDREWSCARAWLYREINGKRDDDFADEQT